MIETDMLYAQVRSDDWLKPTAEKLMQRIVRGDFGIVASREVFDSVTGIKRMDPRTL
jgi:hypothetical protein